MYNRPTIVMIIGFNRTEFLVFKFTTNVSIYVRRRFFLSLCILIRTRLSKYNSKKTVFNRNRQRVKIIRYLN